MPSNLVRLPTAEVQACPNCDGRSARLSFEDERFPYGSGESQVMLQARVPVWTCAACGTQFTASEAEDVRHAEICRYLGRLNPAQLRALREHYGVSQEEWSNRTGFGIASTKRWESGNLIQNEAADRYIRLLMDADNFSKVTHWAESPETPAGSYQFQTKLPNAAFRNAAVFVLRKSYGHS